MNKYNALPFPLTENIRLEIDCIDNFFLQEVALWKGKNKIKLLILAEAPLSYDKYFYNRIRGNFLGNLRSYLKVDHRNFLMFFRQKGIFTYRGIGA